jgi:N-hydroxyarylamine O-acetyltransferase
MDLDAYFRRIGHEGLREPTLLCLEALHFAHVTHIPFENLDIQLGLPIRLDLDALQAKLVQARRGGYCFEHNTLFAAVLARLGFQFDTLEARVRLGIPELTSRSHMTLKVHLPDGDWLADVGFGGEGLLGPVPFGEGEFNRFGDSYRLAQEGRLTVLQRREPDGWFDLYAVEPEPVHPIDRIVGNHYTSTYPESRFVTTLTVQLPTPEARHILRNRTYSVLRGGRTDVRELQDPEELLQLLRETFGLEFPAGTRFRNPVF